MTRPYTCFQIEPEFWCIEENSVRCFLLEGKNEALLIDAGYGSGDLKEYISTITPLPIRQLVVTHADRDHIGCATQFEQVLIHPSEFDRYASNHRDCSCLIPLWEDTKISIGRWTFTVILLPGHTPGSIALLDEGNRILIGGDCVQTAAIYMFGPGRNLPAFIHSIDRLQQLSFRYDKIYSSHGTLALSPEILPILKEGALQVLHRQIKGTPPPRDLPCLLYQWKEISFLYDG